ncbi:carboxymuconolactone decarboxylase family protein [Cupriavidus necator]|uniref:carboxymuconolactone decarboxylase family protein n=1 Tax=Cupriavidus necator TaxID=106590 RepID=UPI0005B3AAE5|nr:carboxymuconolactone decarboxylase family protein [Cupriavidus necator]
MSIFQAYTADSAPAESKETLKGATAAFGFLPNLHAYMAEAPELLKGYAALWDLFAKTTLTPQEQQVVFLTANFENNCRYCMAGHSALAKMVGMDADTIGALRGGKTLPDKKLEALHRFATTVVQQRGAATEKDVQDFLSAGYTRRNALEVVLGVATKVLSNYTNHIVQTPLDPFMKGNEWTKPEHAVA